MARILVVDDEESIRFTLASFITEEGHDVATSSDFDGAMENIEHTDFDLVIADIILGGKSGIDFLRECREKGRNFPVVFITGYPDVSTAVEAVRLNAFDYLYKPVEREALLQVTEQALRSAKAAQEEDLVSSQAQNILRSVQDTIITVDTNNVVTKINEGAKPICSFTKSAIGKDFHSLTTGCSGKCLQPLEETLKTHKAVRAFHLECKQPADGNSEARIMDASSYPLLDPSGCCAGAVLVLRDEPDSSHIEESNGNRCSLHHLIGKSRKMQKVYSVIESLANVESTVLIVGESGTGKELVAEALHHLGKRSSQPLVKVNCSALSESLLESELFGHVKGAFTGATTDRMGRFQKANGGTIFLDEVGDISPKVQSSLLRVIQQREFERVGDSNPIRVDVRIVAATNKDLDEMAKRDAFREDLLYRLKVVQITVPPLRERMEDLPLLIDHFLTRFSQKMGRETQSISWDVEKRFREYVWPGNVRELEHALEHACVICSNHVIALDNLPAYLTEPILASMRSPAQKHTVESSEILSVLRQTDWNKKKSARLLGIDRKTLYRNMAKYGSPNSPDKSD